MSANTILIVIGAILLLVGLAKLGQSGGFNLSNFGITIGGTSRQTNTVGNVSPGSSKSGKPDWIGLGIAIVGLLTALVGLLKG